MQDIARRAGVSAATVSMSLRNKPNIPAATRARIAAIARRLGYKPNPYVSALMRTRRSGRALASRPVVALVNALDQADAWRDAPAAIRRRMREGALLRASELGYEGQEFWLHQEGMSPDRFSEMLHARGIQGLLLGPRPDGAPPPPLRWDYFSAVSLSVPLPTLTLRTVCNDHFFSSLRAVLECHRLGYRRPGFVLRASHRVVFQGRWEAGFAAGQQSAVGIEPTQPLFVESVEEVATFQVPVFSRWLKRENPDVIITLGHDCIEAVLLKLGYRIPRDIGLVGLSCPEPMHRVSGIYQNGELIGATAMEILVGHLERHEKGLPTHGVTTMVEGMWNPGETLRRQPMR
jgi:LacI family transcriptional regulator